MATLAFGALEAKTALFFAIGFLVLFSAGGCTGVILSNAGLDIVLHDTYFVVGHFHYVLSMGAVFGLFTGFYHWIGLITGRLYVERLGIISFGLIFLGANLTFFPMHFLGLSGMPRRIPDYPDVYGAANMLSSVGSLISLIGMLVFVLLICRIFESAGMRCFWFGSGSRPPLYSVRSFVDCTESGLEMGFFYLLFGWLPGGNVKALEVVCGGEEDLGSHSGVITERDSSTQAEDPGSHSGVITERVAGRGAYGVKEKQGTRSVWVLMPWGKFKEIVCDGVAGPAHS